MEKNRRFVYDQEKLKFEWPKDKIAKLISLIASGDIFLSDSCATVPEPFRGPLVLCNDFFAPGADCEELMENEVGLLYEVSKKFPRYGTPAFCSYKQKWISPPERSFVATDDRNEFYEAINWLEEKLNETS